MICEMSLINNLADKMQKRTATLLKMKSLNLGTEWLQEFDLQQIMDCCNRMDAHLLGTQIIRTSCQRELIQNPAFAAYYAELLPMFPEEPPVERAPAPAYTGHYGYKKHYAYTPVQHTPPSRRSELLNRLSKMLDLCWESKQDITVYPTHSLMDVLELDQLNTSARLVYLINFLSDEQSKDHKQAAISGLSVCMDPPLHLDPWKKNLLRKPFTATRNLFRTTDFEEICKLLCAYPEIENILKLLHERNIRECLGLEDYKIFTDNATERISLLESVAGQLGPDNTAEFIFFWKKSNYSMDELRRMNRQILMHTALDWDSVFSNYSGYVNLLYGSRFKTIDLSKVQSYQEDILTYAIVHGKKRFIKLVDANAEQFLCLPRAALLLQPELYEEHFNLNELTEKDLESCQWMRSNNFDESLLMPARKYTFPELTALYNTPAIYIKCYNLLLSESQDYRLRVLRQLLKRNVLKSYMEPDLPALVDKLNVKPLLAWKEQEFGHITGLTAEDTVQLLIHFKEVRHLLPDIHHRADVILALKNLASLPQIDSIDSLKSNIAQIDAEWHALIEDMGLSEEFLSQHQESIINFVVENGVYIAKTYADTLDEVQRKSFYRVVKAEVMGCLHTLKYFEGDLQRELDMPLAERVRTGWSKNIAISEAGMEARECDDFFSTMLLGTQPQRTCLSYIDGIYKQCLLSAFDSNKKVLYVFLNGHIVGRAFLRLTKGRMTGTAPKDGKNGFTFVDVEDIPSSRNMEQSVDENLTLFLERPYISGVNPDQKTQVTDLMIKLACEKADELGTILVLSRDYCPRDQGFTQTLFDIYISKSKAGAQYLDSLDGEATVSAEGSYKANSFLVREYQPLRSI